MVITNITHLKAQRGDYEQVTPLALVRVAHAVRSDAARRYGSEWMHRADIVELVHLIFALYVRKAGIVSWVYMRSGDSPSYRVTCGQFVFDLASRSTSSMLTSVNLDQWQCLGSRTDEAMIERHVRRHEPDWDGKEMLHMHLADPLGLTRTIIRARITQKARVHNAPLPPIDETPPVKRSGLIGRLRGDQ